jgi:peptidylprolyl isomerase domain and WD repeat-containing protein 1
MDTRKQRKEEDEELIGPVPKRRKVLKFEKVYLDQLPAGELYEKSFMHVDIVTHVVVTKSEFIITGSLDGSIKFWKKQPIGIEPVTYFRVHTAPITGMAVSKDGTLMCSVSADKTLKLYDVLNFDMTQLRKLDFMPSGVEFVSTRGKILVACLQADSEIIHLIDFLDESKTDQQVNLHSAPVILIKYNEKYDAVISIDKKGIPEYWSPTTLEHPQGLSFQYKTETDLFEFAKVIPFYVIHISE